MTPSSDLRTEEGRGEVQEGAHDESITDEARRRGIARNSPAVEAEQGMPELLMAAAARGTRDGNGNLGFQGFPGRPYMELSSTGWPRGSTATATARCERGGEDALERRRSKRHWQVGPAGKRLRTASPDQTGLRGEGEKELGRGRKGIGPSILKGFFYLNKTATLLEFCGTKGKEINHTKM